MEITVSYFINNCGIIGVKERGHMVKVPLTVSHPEIASSWSKKNPISPDKVSKGTVKKYLWECDKYSDHTYLASPNARTRPKIGTKCPYCSGTKIKAGFNDLATKEPDIAKQWSSNNELSAKEVFPNSNKLYLWVCDKGHEYSAKPLNRVSLGRGCPYCAGRYSIEGETDLTTTHPEVANMWSPNNSRPVTEAKGKSNWKALWVCPEYGLEHEWEEHIMSMTRSPNCKYCDGSRVLKGFNDLGTIRPELIDEWSRKNEKSIHEYSSGSSERVLWECSNGHEWEGPISGRKNSGCAVCGGKKVLEGYNDLASLGLDILEEWSQSNTISPNELTRNSGYRAVWNCHKDISHEWVASVNDRTRLDGKATGCPYCARGRSVSKMEQELQDFLTDLGIDFTTNRRDILSSGRELDIVIEGKNMAIEFNGLFFHSDYRVNDKNYHRDKWVQAKEAGYQLITIWSDDWKYRKDIVQRMLKHKLGMSNETRVYARKTKVVTVDYKVAKEFLDKYHLQGSVGGTYYLGLKSKGSNEIVAIMVLKANGSMLRLERYATSCQVVGGQSKLLKYVDQNITYEKMVTFADLTVSDGNLYEKTGWKLDKVLDPDYKYLVSGRLEHKFNYRKSNFKNRDDLLFEEGLTEAELAKLNKLYRVYDCGKLRYTR